MEGLKILAEYLAVFTLGVALCGFLVFFFTRLFKKSYEHSEQIVDNFLSPVMWTDQSIGGFYKVLEIEKFKLKVIACDLFSAIYYDDGLEQFFYSKRNRKISTLCDIGNAFWADHIKLPVGELNEIFTVMRDETGKYYAQNINPTKFVHHDTAEANMRKQNLSLLPFWERVEEKLLRVV